MGNKNVRPDASTRYKTMILINQTNMAFNINNSVVLQLENYIGMVGLVHSRWNFNALKIYIFPS